MTNFSALVVDQVEEDVQVDIKKLTEDDLPEGDILIRVHYSSVNYKDGLASIPDGNIVKSYPFVPGIDLAGTIVSSKSEQFSEGEEVLITGYDLGVTHYGGFSEYARVPEEWVVRLPKNLSLKEAMAYGTAGFTAALSVYRLEEHGLSPDRGSILVTGATGGVGSLAVSILAKRGYDVVASTGKETEHDYLKKLGAKDVIDRKELQPEKIRPLNRQLWAGAVDPVGGKILAHVLSSIKYGGAVAVSGLTGGVQLPASVFPFILRGVNLLGVDSVFCPMDLRVKLWDKMANEYKPDHLTNDISKEISLEELPELLAHTVKGKSKGRNVVKME